MPGQKFGPAWFPGLIAVGLGVCGALLVVQACAQRRAAGRARRPGCARAARARRCSRCSAGCVFYILAADPLGFHLTARPDRSALWVRVLGASWRVDDRRSRSSRTLVIHSPSTSCCACRCPGACSSAGRSDVTRSSQAFALVFDPYVLWVILASAVFGLFVGAVPGPHRDHGDRAAGAGDLLHAAGAGDRLASSPPPRWRSSPATSRAACCACRARRPRPRTPTRRTR